MKKFLNIKLTNFNTTIPASMSSPTPISKALPLNNSLLTKEEFISLPSNELDCDWAAFTIYTKDWFKLTGPLSTIQLLSHKPACRDNIGEFSKWVYIGTGTGYIKIPPKYKQPLITAIKDYGIQLSENINHLTLIKGNQHIMALELGAILLGNYYYFFYIIN
jgi:hypothetical protein